MCAFVLVDPVCCGGHNGRSWRTLEPELAKIYPFMTPVFPQRRSEMAPLVAAALRDGHTEIVAIGGRTFDEAVNGFFNPEGSISPDAVLAFLPIVNNAVGRLSIAMVRPIDVGRISYLSNAGKARTRYFATTAEFGRAPRQSALQSRSLLAYLFGDCGFAMRLIIDQSFDEIVTIRAVTFSNGRALGDADALASNGKLDDGKFDIAIVPGRGGNAITRLRGHHIIAAPVAETLGRRIAVALDGQSVGRLPATLDILPRALNVRC